MRRRLAALALAIALPACASTGDGPRSGGVRPYPLGDCLVTRTKLGSMGDPIVKVYGDREIRFCCPPCVDEFERNPAKFLKLLPE